MSSCHGEEAGSIPVRTAKREVTKAISTRRLERWVSRFDSCLLDKKMRVDLWRFFNGSQNTKNIRYSQFGLLVEMDTISPCHGEGYGIVPRTDRKKESWLNGTMPACHAVWYGFESRWFRKNLSEGKYNTSYNNCTIKLRGWCYSLIG